MGVQNMLVVKLRPIEGESWAGYLLRLSNANHLAGIRPIASLFQTTVTTLLMQPAEVRAAFVDCQLQQHDAKFQLRSGKGTRPTAHGFSKFARICPKCISEHEYIRADWDRSFRLSCTKHATALVDQCHGCGNRIMVDRHRLAQCNCGADLSQIRTPIASNTESWLIHLLDVQKEYSQLAVTFAPTSPKEIAAVRFCWRYAQLRTLGSRLSTDKVPRLADPLLDLRLVKKIASDLADWPVRFDATLQQAARHSSSRFLSQFPRLWAKDRTLIPIVHSHLSALQHVRRNSPKPGRREATEIPIVPMPYVGIKCLMRSAGCTYDTARHWIATGVLGQVDVQVDAVGRTQYRIATDSVRAVSAAAKSLTTFCEAANILEVDNTALRMLARAGVIPTVPFGRTNKNVRIVTTEFYSLAQRVLLRAKNVKRRQIDDIGIDRLVVRIGARSKQALQRFFDSIYANEVQLLRLDNNANSWRSLHMDPNEYTRWLKRDQSLCIVPDPRLF
jgi:TniQ